MQKTQQISGATLLTVDRWDTYAGAQLLGTETVDFASLGDRPCPAGTVSRDSLLALLRLETPIEDCRVLQLLREFDPNKPLAESFNTAAVDADYDPFSVLYWNWPGFGPATWKAAFEDPATGRLQRKYEPAISVYVHPFIAPVTRPRQPGAALRVHPAILVLLPVQRRRQQARGGLGAHQRGHQSDVAGDRPPDRRAGRRSCSSAAPTSSTATTPS